MKSKQSKPSWKVESQVGECSYRPSATKSDRTYKTQKRKHG
ncbi:hypothetical protein [Nostoc sp. ChiQUE01b]|nr:hypothetical protein [Nostoc sp. ChiQUE01b]